MIIWGSKTRQTRGKTGSFFCPGCQLDKGYAQVKWSRYFTLYFIPLFPTETLETRLECNSCKGQFKESVLGLSREQILAATTPWKCNCGNTNPPGQSRCLGCGHGMSGPPELPA